MPPELEFLPRRVDTRVPPLSLGGEHELREQGRVPAGALPRSPEPLTVALNPKPEGVAQPSTERARTDK